MKLRFVGIEIRNYVIYDVFITLYIIYSLWNTSSHSEFAVVYSSLCVKSFMHCRKICSDPLPPSFAKYFGQTVMTIIVLCNAELKLQVHQADSHPIHP